MSSSSSSTPSLRRPCATPPLTDARKSRLAPKVAEATQVIKQALDKYGLDRLALSFNGGKDCTVLLHLLHTLLPPPAFQPSTPAHNGNGTSLASTLPEPDQPVASSSSASRPPIRAIYITAPAPFPSVEAFVDDCSAEYGLDLVRIGGGMKDALSKYLAPGSAGAGVEGVLVGTRRGDPHGAELSLFQKTDPSWPQFMRIHPILDWSYTDIWDYLRLHDVPWCDLYDEGFTSLGSQLNTHPNPALALPPPAPAGSFGPAWQLEDESLERAGRGDPPAKVLVQDGALEGDGARKAVEEDDSGDRS